MRIGYVHNKNKQVRIAGFLKSRVESPYQIMGQVTDKSYGIREQEGQIVYNYFAHRGVQGGKEFVLGKDLALGE